jgi:hypothetical protein
LAICRRTSPRLPLRRASAIALSISSSCAFNSPSAFAAALIEL